MGSFIRRIVFVALAASIFFPGWQIPAAQGQTCTNLYGPPFCQSYPLGGPYTRWQCFVNLTPYTGGVYHGCNSATGIASGGKITRCYYIKAQRRLIAAQALGDKGAGYCEITCNCGTLRIDQDDGLPVELMGFSIE